MIRIIKLLIIILFLIILLPREVLAVDITISNYPTSITADPFNVTVSVSGPNDGVNYLRVDLYKDGSTNYFGETYNGSNWYGGSTGTDYFSIQILNSSASATIQAKTGNPTSSEYQGSGVYKLRIRRYTSSGNASSGDNQTPIDIQINLPTPTPSPTPNPTPTPNPQTPNPTPLRTSAPTGQAPTPTKTPTKSPTISPSPTPELEVLAEKTENIDPAESETSKPVLIKDAGDKKKIPLFIIIIIAVGFILIGVAGYMAYKIRYNSLHEQKN